ncbi:ribosome-inactivating family protein [Streptomyces olindensis]|uniref:ribosome-inactivating family protein n=1 Tax=Streptomyces olindensis TaxID=358823 RepID=UPI0033EB80DA
MNLTSPAAGPAPDSRTRKRRSRLLSAKFLTLSLAGATLLGGAALVVPQFQDKANAADPPKWAAPDESYSSVTWDLDYGQPGADSYGAFIRALRDTITTHANGRREQIPDPSRAGRGGKVPTLAVDFTDPGQNKKFADIVITAPEGQELHAVVRLSNLYVAQFYCADPFGDKPLKYNLAEEFKQRAADNRWQWSRNFPEDYNTLGSSGYANRALGGVQLGATAFDSAVKTLCSTVNVDESTNAQEPARAIQTLIVGISEATRFRDLSRNVYNAWSGGQEYQLTGVDDESIHDWGKLSEILRNNGGGSRQVGNRIVDNAGTAAQVLQVALGGPATPPLGGEAPRRPPQGDPPRRCLTDGETPDCISDGTREQAATKMDYVALGDSYSAGTGAAPYLPNDKTITPPGPDLKVINPPASVNHNDNCQRSEQAYGALAAKEYGGPQGFIGSFTFAACQGAVTQNVRDGQLAALTPDTDLVTLTIGGNDVEFANAMTECVKPHVGPPGEASPTCGTALDRSFLIMRTALGGMLKQTYEAVLNAAPNARVVVLGYPKLFDEQGQCEIVQGNFNPTPQARKAMNDAAVELNQTIQKVVAQVGGETKRSIQFVDVQPVFDGHGICGNDPFLTEPISVAPAFHDAYHPNAKGHERYKSLIAGLFGA